MIGQCIDFAIPAPWLSQGDEWPQAFVQIQGLFMAWSCGPYILETVKFKRPIRCRRKSTAQDWGARLWFLA